MQQKFNHSAVPILANLASPQRRLSHTIDRHLALTEHILNNQRNSSSRREQFKESVEQKITQQSQVTSTKLASAQSKRQKMLREKKSNSKEKLKQITVVSSKQKLKEQQMWKQNYEKLKVYQDSMRQFFSEQKSKELELYKQYNNTQSTPKNIDFKRLEEIKQLELANEYFKTLQINSDKASLTKQQKLHQIVTKMNFKHASIPSYRAKSEQAKNQKIINKTTELGQTLSKVDSSRKSRENFLKQKQKDSREKLKFKQINVSENKSLIKQDISKKIQQTQDLYTQKMMKSTRLREIQAQSLKKEPEIKKSVEESPYRQLQIEKILTKHKLANENIRAYKQIQEMIKQRSLKTPKNNISL